MLSHQNWFLQLCFANFVNYPLWVQPTFHMAVSFSVSLLWEKELRKKGGSHEFTGGGGMESSPRAIEMKEVSIPSVDCLQKGWKTSALIICGKFKEASEFLNAFELRWIISLRWEQVWNPSPVKPQLCYRKTTLTAFQSQSAVKCLFKGNSELRKHPIIFY